MSAIRWRGTRRAFLGGAGTAVALPFLPSLLPREARAAVAPPVRLVCWYAPCGMVMDQWRPSADGPLGALPRILAPLVNVQSDVLVLSGLANAAAMVPVAGDHARGTGSFLTCRTVAHTADADIQNGISVDQVAAAAFEGLTPFKSLELGTTGGSPVGDCDSGYSCAYTRNVSWLDEDTPNPKLTDPAVVFDRLFAGFDPTLTAEQIAQRKAWRTSVLDYVLDEADRMLPKLSAADQAKLDEYMTGVRDLETRIQGETTTCLPGERPSSGLEYAAVVRAMSDLTVLALQCDLTRVVTFMLENGGSYRSFDFLGVTGGHHELSHHQGDPVKIESLAVIDTWEVGELAYLLERMRDTTDSEGNALLDHSVVVLSSEISDGDWHNHDDLPVLVAGSGGGAVATGRHVTLPDDTPIADLYLALLDAAGVPATTFGNDGTSPLDLG